MNKARKKRNVHRQIDNFVLHLTDTNTNNTFLYLVRWHTTHIKPNAKRLMNVIGKVKEFNNCSMGIKSISKI